VTQDTAGGSRRRRPGRYIPIAVRRAVRRRDGGRCVYCRARARLGFDHVVPRVKGGGRTPDNLVLCCGPCNEKKADWDLDLFAQRLAREGVGSAAQILARVARALATPVET
jgi:5-methylcytosine-specific restriction endonuclease McrA